VREFVDGVIEIPIGYVNAYAVIVDDGVVLIDTGLPGRAGKVASAVVAARRRIGDVHTILLTHWHPDHVGGVAELRRRSRARIVAHGIDAPVISGEESRLSNRFLRIVGAIMPSPEPVPVDEVLTGDCQYRVLRRSIPPATLAGIPPFCSTAPAAYCSRVTWRVVGAAGASAVRYGW